MNNKTRRTWMVWELEVGLQAFRGGAVSRGSVRGQLSEWAAAGEGRKDHLRHDMKKPIC